MAKDYSGSGPSMLGEGDAPYSASTPDPEIDPGADGPSHAAFDAMDNGMPDPENVEYE